MTKIRKSARGKDCQIRIPGYCRFDRDTVVAAHLNGYGIGGKHSDLFTARCCSICHDILDGRNRQHPFTQEQLMVFFYEGMIRTQQQYLDEGLVKL